MVADNEPPNTTEPTAPMRPAAGETQDYTDGRGLWQWESKYPPEAWRKMNFEAYALIAMLVVFILCAGVCLGLADQNISISLGDAKLSISFRLLTIFFSGLVGGLHSPQKPLKHSREVLPDEGAT